ncbi:hypothetical protein CRUP_005117 [Coryphaenoides rupestris]|nr:hypothetical protein CRUP_005117 [Coryphaenoides rupestris]
MDYESQVFPRCGGSGRYSRLVVVSTWLPTFAAVLNLCCDAFYSQVPELYHCRPDPALLPAAALLLTNYSAQGYLDLAVPRTDNGSGLSHCLLYKYPTNISTPAAPHAGAGDFPLPREKVPCTRGWEYTHGAGLRSNYVTEWDLVCSDFWMVPLQHICFMTGWILGYILLGTLCDWLGRRRTLLVSISLSSVLGVALCISSSPVVFLLLRLAQGASLAGGVGMCYDSVSNCSVMAYGSVLGLEVCDPPHRLMVVMIGGFFGVGAELLLPGIAVLCRDWPVLQAVVTLPLILLLSYWCCESVFPESPRWLLSTFQLPQAKRNAGCLREGGVHHAGERLLAELDSVYGDDCQPEFHTVLELRHTRVIWKNCLILSFTLTAWHAGKPVHRGFLVGRTCYFLPTPCAVLTGALSCLFLCVSVNRFGRRGILLLSAIVTGLSSLLLLALTLCSGGCLGLVFAAGCVGIAASSLMELQNNAGYFLHHVIFASFAVLSVLCIMLLPESKRKPLPDSLADGENRRRPPLFLSRGGGRGGRDSLPLLRTSRPCEYNPDSYARLVSATRRMLSKDGIPYKMAAHSRSPPPTPPPTPPPLAVAEEDEEVELWQYVLATSETLAVWLHVT